MFPGLDLYCIDPAPYIITAGWDLDDLDRDLSDLPDSCNFRSSHTKTSTSSLDHRPVTGLSCRLLTSLLVKSTAADESGDHDGGSTKANPPGNHHREGLPQYGCGRRWPRQPLRVHVPHARRASEI